ncbi:M23 family metallopeptidase [Schaalia hyovaginalis]|uniref:Murein DD-endopeptidase MepM/ murein hydrolase activator NlpD n=1 Tax=Schaalia hyovaginalis TaxID=29316 RepID=A0A923E560_9ACTO|nr:murein DD-endopeptidase MepM/ murein hydrolase activator NlpD [Schaalia hyovaginalis]
MSEAVDPCPLPSRREIREREASRLSSASARQSSRSPKGSSVFAVAKAGVLTSLLAMTVVVPLSGFVGSDASISLPSRAMGTAVGTTWMQGTRTVMSSSLAGSATAVSRARFRAPLTVTQCIPVETSANGERSVAVERRTVYMPIEVGRFQSTSPFGPRIHPVNGSLTFHTGTDMAAPLGTPLHAVYSGVVADVYFDPYGGDIVKIRHEFPDGTVFYSLYLHQYANQIVVTKGQNVEAGQVIGAVGSNGRSTGPHLHLEIHNASDDPVDPDAWLAANGAIDINQEACS